MAFNWHDWDFTRDEHWLRMPWWMDRRHTELLYALVMTGMFPRVLEIGCHHGSSSSALVQAVADDADVDLHLVEKYQSVKLERVIGAWTQKVSLHYACSLRVLPQRRWDLVIVDGDHSVAQVSRELGLLLAQEVPTIVGHDVTAHDFASCAGAIMLGDLLQRHPAYQCLLDCETRPDEWTHRGLLLATRDPAIMAAAQPLWDVMLAAGFATAAPLVS